MDYSKLEFKAGLECHQQLNTGKLFCRCPSVLMERKPDGTILRYLRPYASELGTFDPAALEQFQRGYHYIYEYYHDTNCELELDESPPKEPDPLALKTILEVALMTGSNILKKIFMMRKLVIDGSNTAGFQRTALVAIGGKIKLKNKELGIQTIVLEEDSARPIKKTHDQIIYRVDRLGIPLIEIATEPELYSPEEVKEAALAIGNLFRLTGRAKRGLGTIRQDINVSIKGGARIEIKGVQDLDNIDEYVKREIQRQQSLIEIKHELEKRGVNENDINEKSVDLTKIFTSTNCKFIKNAKNASVLGVKLKKFKGILGKEIQPNKRFGTELSHYVKARSGISGIIHSDELPGFDISEKEVNEINQVLKCLNEDAFVFVVGKKDKVQKAVKTVQDRCKIATKLVPSETRNALEDGNTSYSRPIAGSARMYPETNLDPLEFSQEEIDEARKNLPMTVSQRRELFIKKFGLSENLADQMKLNNFARFFIEMVKKGFDPKKTAVVLLDGLTYVKRMGGDIDILTNEMLEDFFEKRKSGEIKKEIYTEVLFEWTKNPQKSLEEILLEKNVIRADKNEVESIIKKIIKQNETIIKEKKEHALGALMGEAMKKLKGKARGQEISSALKKELKDALK